MVRRSLAGIAGLAAVVALAACIDQDPQAPARPEFAVQSGQCSFQAASQLVGDYFTDNTTRQLVRELIRDMRQAGAGSDVARDKGFDVFAQVAANVDVNTNTAAGSALVNAVIACMYTSAAELPLTYPENFTTALDATKNGAFAVRGKAGVDETGVVYARINKFSGVYPIGGDWTASLDQNPAPARVLLYGQPGTLSLEHYDWRTFPHNATFDPALIVGLCIDESRNNSREMVQKKNAEGTSYLPFVDAWFLDPLNSSSPYSCVSSALALEQSWSPRHLAASLFRLGVELIGPRPLFATGTLLPGGLGGTTGGVRTEYGPDIVETVTLTFLTQPTDAQVCTTQPCSGGQNIGTGGIVKILATHNGFPVGGVKVDLEAVDNNGSWVELFGSHPDTTSENGTITFTDLGLNKPGGYQLITIAELVVQRSTSITIPSVTSDKFNVRP